jgi:16S rRNA (cytosine967-C5)-methyltransferase
LAIDLAKLKDVSPARLAAFDILRKVEDGAFSSVLLATEERELKQVDRALCHELVMGVLRWQLHLDRIIEHYANRGIDTIDVAVRLALRLGLYQLRFLSRVPAAAAVNESVNLVLYARLRSAQGLVNAVLRRATREPDYDPVADTTDPIEQIAIHTSHPAWLVERWVNTFGLKEAREFAGANNETPPTAIRIVQARASESDVLRKLRAAGAVVAASSLSKGAWRVTGGQSLLRDLQRIGKIYIQDEASQLVAQVLGAQPGERVLDLCAAPGSKTSQIADRAGDRCRVVATDVSERRLRTVTNAAALHQLENIERLILDAGQQLPFREGCFDRVLLDAPCSGTGTLRRNPEIRYRISAEDIPTLSARQKQFLLNAANAVKPGGRLIYSTCSVEPEENEEVVDTFLSSNEHFRQISVPVDSLLLTPSGAARTWPQRHGADGFFIAALERQT